MLSLQPVAFYPFLGLVIILSQAFSLATIHTMQSWAQPDIHPRGLTLLLSLEPISWRPCLGLVIILNQALLLTTIHTMQSWAQPDIHPGSHASAEPRANKFHTCLGWALILSQALSLATVHTMQSWAQPDIHPGSHTSVEPSANTFASLPGIGRYFKPSSLIGYSTYYAVLGSARYPPRVSHFCWASSQ